MKSATLSPLTTGAIEKQKLVYILNRDAAARLTISSPLEAHKANTLVYHVVGVDVGFENPMFACLEMDYEVPRCLPPSSSSLAVFVMSDFFLKQV
jgi:splicing factor 3B subunit 3